MSFVVHQEELNLVSAVAAEDDDDDADEQSLDEPHHRRSHAHDLLAVFSLAVPTMVVQTGQVIPNFLTASYIGRNMKNVVYLDGFTLASLTGNLFTLSLLQGLYSASDTLSPQAYGAGNYAEVGYLAVRGFAGSLLVVLPAMFLLDCFMGELLVAAGQDPDAALLAWRWYQIYSISLPFYALYEVTWKFLSAQNVMKPLVVCVLVSNLIVLPTALYFAGNAFGFLGTALAIVIYNVVQSLLLLLYLWYWTPHNAATWIGLTPSFQAALQCKPFYAYMALGAGGMLASSEWIYWETLSLIIGRFGVIPLSVHTIPTQVIMVSFMGPLGLGIALSIRLGATLPNSVARAKRTVRDCLIFSFVVFGGMAVAMYTERYAIYSWFTSNANVIKGCEEIWFKVCMYSLQLSIFGVLMGACVGLGMQWTLGTTTVVVLWIFGLPAAYFMAVVRDGGLNAAWTAIWPPYLVINLVLGAAIIVADWDNIAQKIRIREGIELKRTTDHETDATRPFIDSYGSIGKQSEVIDNNIRQ
jgi:multidrug resistance protein, MATE family